MGYSLRNEQNVVRNNFNNTSSFTFCTIGRCGALSLWSHSLGVRMSWCSISESVKSVSLLNGTDTIDAYCGVKGLWCAPKISQSAVNQTMKVECVRVAMETSLLFMRKQSPPGIVSGSA